MRLYLVDHAGRLAARHRDRALLLVGFAGALRRSELSALDVRRHAETGDGLRISVGRS